MAILTQIKRWWMIRKKISFWDEALQRKAIWYLSANVKRIAVIALIFLFSACAGWDKQDKILYASYLTLSAVDAIQTSQMDEEYNPLMQKGDGSPDMAKVIGIKAVSGLGVYFLADYFPKARTPILWGVNVLQGGVVILNGFQF